MGWGRYPGRYPASALLRGPQLRSGSEGRYPAPPRIEVPGRFFGAPWWPPPEACSVALNCGLAARAGIPPLPNSAPRPLFWGALVASASVLLRGPQFRIAWLLVATETIVVQRNKYRFRILHIYAMKPITWQPSRIQTDGERQWAETVLCFIGGPRETVYSDCSLLDQRAKMQDSVCSLAHFRAYAGPVGHTETDDTWNPWATETLLGSRRSR